ncbi:MAG: hypothetical protein BGO67_11250 [Alphaproteobacteria bacterium 41-28]|nr:MAG: hypothetical protein BGO67_11250 [Alphaproteobacteria bacterium 41-28]
MKLFDPKAYHLHHKRAKKTFHAHNFLFDHVGYELVLRLNDLKKSFNKPLNLSPHSLPYPSLHHPSLEDDLPYPESSFDLILSCLQGHWVNNLLGHLKSIHRCLQKDGLFLGALWGGQTLFELRESLLQAELVLTGGASPRMAPLLHPKDAPSLLGSGGFFMPVVDTEIISVTYPSLRSLMKDLRGMGETNKLYDRPKMFTPRILFDKAEEIYKDTYGLSNGILPATFEVIYLTGWKYKG